MTDIATTLQRCHQIVWAARKELEPYWPTPSVYHSLRFAACEAAEALDAQMRQLPQYARNNDKTLSVDDELADCLMMLMTAIGPDAAMHLEDIADGWDEPTDGIDHLLWCVAELAAFWGTQGHEVEQVSNLWFCASEIVVMIGPSINGPDALEVLTARLERIKWKRLPESWYIDNGKKVEWYYGHYKFDRGGEMSFDEWKAAVSPIALDTLLEAQR